MTYFLHGTQNQILYKQNVKAALFHAMKVNSDHRCQVRFFCELTTFWSVSHTNYHLAFEDLKNIVHKSHGLGAWCFYAFLELVPIHFYCVEQNNSESYTFPLVFHAKKAVME